MSEDHKEHIKEVEGHVLSAMIQSERALELALTILKDDDFVVLGHQFIFQTITKLFKENQGIDIATISEMLVKQKKLDQIGGLEYLGYLVQNYINDINLKEHIDILIERSKKRQLEKVLKNLNRELTGEKTANDILMQAEAQIIQVSSERNSEDLVPIGGHIDEVIERIEKLQKSGESLNGITSGINNLDDITSGFQPGDLIILAARPSMGKTALALNFALNAASSLKTKKEAILIFSLEMPRDQLITRMISCKGNFDAHKLRNKYKFKHEDWVRITTTAEKLKQQTIIIDDTPGLRILELQTKLRKLAREYDIKMVVIDYLQLLSGSNTESRQQEVSNISRSLKVSARELNVPIICLSQLSRLVERREEKRPLMSDLRESGAIEQDADLIMFLYRDDYYKEQQKTEEDKDSSPQENHVAEILISKHRNGPTGKVLTVFIPKWGKFENYQNS